jgi:hypothetical protein
MLAPSSIISDAVSFDLDPYFTTIDTDGCPVLSQHLIERCRFMFGNQFYWTIVCRPSHSGLGIQLTIPALSTEAYLKLFQFETRELSARPWRPSSDEQ